MKSAIKNRIMNSFTIFIMMAAFFLAVFEVYAAEDVECTNWSASNKSSQNYSRWSSAVKSYLYEIKDGYMRVQYSGSDGLFVEYYDSELQLEKVQRIAEELPIFGGVYGTDTHFYLVTGQTNNDESADVEVFRITKYDKEWNKIASTGLFDCNTTIPFDAGSLRMTDDGQYLMIRTCHEMYTSSDGYNHQANVTIQMDMDTMKITSSFTDVMNYRYGYVSHSFNQFIKIDNGKLVTLDHGDAYPRSFAVINYTADISTGNFLKTVNCDKTDIMTFAGEIGDNTTNASAGAFEVTSSTYLMAGNSVVQDENFAAYSTRNIFVAVVDKSTKAVTTTWLTDYAEGEATTKTPHLVKIADDLCLILWERENHVYYTTVDAYGKQTSDTYKLTGNLSDCVPILSDGKIIWYVCDDNEIDFYQINVADLESNSVVKRKNGHDYQYESATDGIANLKCSKCGEMKEATVPTSIKNLWNSNGGSTYSSVCSFVNGTGTKLYLVTRKSYESSLGEYLSDIEVEVSDESGVEITETSSSTSNTFVMIHFKKAGTYTITTRAKYNPSVSLSYTFRVYDPLSIESFTADGQTQQKYGENVILTTVTAGGYTGSSIKYTYTLEDENGNVTTLASQSTSGIYVWTPEELGTYTITVTATDGQGSVKKSIEGFTIVKGTIEGVEDIKAEYIYDNTYSYTYDCSQHLASDRGNTSYEIYDITDKACVLSGVLVNTEGMLCYTVNDCSVSGDKASITVKCISDRYEDYYVTFNISITDKKQTLIRQGCEPYADRNLIYGEQLSEASLSGAVFENEDGTRLEGTLVWDEPLRVPDVGEQTASWTFIPDDNEYQKVSGTVSVTVEKAAVQISGADAAIVYNPIQTVSKVALKNFQAVSVITGEKVEGVLVYDTPELVPSVNNTYYNAKFVPSGLDAARYQEKECSVTINVTKATPEITGNAQASAITYGQTLGESQIGGIYATCGQTVVDGVFTFEDPGIKPLVADSSLNNATEYKVVFTPDDKDNYTSVQWIGVSLVVNKSNVSAVKPDSEITVNHMCTKISEIALPDGWTWSDEDKDREIPMGECVKVKAVYEADENHNRHDMEVSVTREGHEYQNSWNWKGYTSANAVFTCIMCGDEQIVDADITEKTIKKASTSKDGVKIYTASVTFLETSYTAQKDKILSKAKVSLSAASYTYNGLTRKPIVYVKGENGDISTENYTVIYPKGRKKVGKYKIIVEFTGDYTGRKVLYFKINPKATSLRSLSAASRKLTVKWRKKTTEVSGYQIQYCTNKKFSSGVKKVTVSGAKNTSKTISGLKAKKTYYVRIRTYKTVNGERIYSSWSKALSKKTK